MTYQLTIRIPFEALDDPEARKRATDILDAVDMYVIDGKNAEKKLQRVLTVQTKSVKNY